jgi:hypothetical protein
MATRAIANRTAASETTALKTGLSIFTCLHAHALTLAFFCVFSDDHTDGDVDSDDIRLPW